MRAPWDVLEPASQGEIERDKRAIARVERFSGAIFALSMALLVLNLVVPQVEGQPTDLAVQGALVQMIPIFLTFVLSFALLATAWMLHHFQFNYLVRTGGEILWINGALMFFVILVPFSTGLASAYAATRTAVVLYELNILAIQALLLLSWRRALKTGLLFGGNVSFAIVRRMRLALTAGTAYVLASIPFTWMSPWLSLGLLAGLAAFYIFLTARGGYTLDAFRQRQAPPTETPWPL